MKPQQQPSTHQTLRHQRWITSKSKISMRVTIAVALTWHYFHLHLFMNDANISYAKLCHYESLDIKEKVDSTLVIP
jgi:hypothetical protein